MGRAMVPEAFSHTVSPSVYPTCRPFQLAASVAWCLHTPPNVIGPVLPSSLIVLQRPPPQTRLTCLAPNPWLRHTFVGLPSFSHPIRPPLHSLHPKLMNRVAPLDPLPHTHPHLVLLSSLRSSKTSGARWPGRAATSSTACTCTRRTASSSRGSRRARRRRRRRKAGGG